MSIQTASVLNDASDGMRKIYLLMILYHGKGKSLAEIKPLLGRQSVTLRKHARKLGLSFVDYVPRQQGVKNEQ